MTQKFENIFFETTEELNMKMAKIIADGNTIDSITPIHSVVYHTSETGDHTQSLNLNIDKICCQEVFVLYHEKE